MLSFCFGVKCKFSVMFSLVKVNKNEKFKILLSGWVGNLFLGPKPLSLLEFET